MGLFSRFTSTGKNVAEKAKDLGTTTRLNARIAAEEAKKNKALAEIGRLFYEKNKDQLGSDYLPYSSQVASADREIAVLKEQLRSLRSGGRICKNCGATMDRHDIYCPVCGVKNDYYKTFSSAEKAAPKNVCPVCQSEVPEGTKFCPTCGEKLTGDAKEPVSDEAISAFAVDTDEPLTGDSEKKAEPEDLDWDARDTVNSSDTWGAETENSGEKWNLFGSDEDKAEEPEDQASDRGPGNLMGAFEDMIGDVKNTAEDFLGNAAEAADKMMDSINMEDTARKVEHFADEAVSKAGEFAGSAFSFLGDAFSEAADAFKKNAPEEAKDSAEEVVADTEDIFRDAVDDAGNAADTIPEEDDEPKEDEDSIFDETFDF